MSQNDVPGSPASAAGSYETDDEVLVVLDDDGNLYLVSADPEGIDVLGKTKLLESPAWTAPTLIGSRLYLRDRKTIMAIDLG